MDLERIKVGIAGLGRSGWDIHANLLSRLPDHFQIVAVVDADAERRQEAVTRFSCRAYTEYKQLLADNEVQLIVVSLPNFLHAQSSIDALAAGKHVVCEKPMATSLEDADRMVKAAAKADTLLTIFQQRRYNPDFVAVRKVIDSGHLGRIVQIRINESKFTRRWDWQTLQKFGGGSLNNTGPHYLDQALQLLGPAEPEVFCQLDRTLTLGDADDFAKIVLKADGAPTIDIEVSSCDAYPGATWHVSGTQGGLQGTTRNLAWKWMVPEEQTPRTLDIRPTPGRTYNRDDIAWHEDSWTLEGQASEAYVQFYADLHQCIENGQPPAITAESVRRVVWLQEECHRLAPLTQEQF